MWLTAVVLCVSDSSSVYCVLPQTVCVEFKLTHAFDAFWVHVCIFRWGIPSVLERSAGCRLTMDSGVRDGLSVPVNHKHQDWCVSINQLLPSDRSLCTHWRVADLIAPWCRENLALATSTMCCTKRADFALQKLIRLNYTFINEGPVGTAQWTLSVCTAQWTLSVCTAQWTLSVSVILTSQLIDGLQVRASSYF